MDAAVLRLPAVLDLGAAKPLWRDLCAARGRALRVDASQVERLGGLCLQVLLAAHASWRADGQAFAIENVSRPYAAAVTAMAADCLLEAESTS